MASEFTIWEVARDTDTSLMPFEGLTGARIVVDVRHPLYLEEKVWSSTLKTKDDYHEFNTEMIGTEQFEEFLVQLKEESKPQEYNEFIKCLAFNSSNSKLVWSQC